MISIRQPTIRRFFVSLAAVAGVGLAATDGRAALLVNSLSGPGASEAIAFESTSGSQQPADQPDELLDGLFHPAGLLLAMSFLPPPMDSSSPPVISPPVSPPLPAKPDGPNDPHLTILVPLPPASGSPPTTPGGSTGGNDGGGGHVHHSPEPTTFVSGMLGFSLLSWLGWRRRRPA